MQWRTSSERVRTGRRAASAAATHHVMQERCKCPRWEGHLQGEGRLRSHIGRHPSPPPPLPARADASGQHGCVSRYSLEAATTPPSLPLLAWRRPAVRPLPLLAQDDRAFARSPLPCRAACRHDPTACRSASWGFGPLRRLARASWRPCVDGGEFSWRPAPRPSSRSHPFVMTIPKWGPPH